MTEGRVRSPLSVFVSFSLSPSLSSSVTLSFLANPANARSPRTAGILPFSIWLLLLSFPPFFFLPYLSDRPTRIDAHGVEEGSISVLTHASRSTVFPTPLPAPSPFPFFFPMRDARAVSGVWRAVQSLPAVPFLLSPFFPPFFF